MLRSVALRIVDRLFGEMPLKRFRRGGLLGLLVLLSSKIAAAQALPQDPEASTPLPEIEKPPELLPAIPTPDEEEDDPTSFMAVEDPSEPENNLEIYGFSDLLYQKILFEKDNRWRSIVNEYDSFIFGNLNLYLSGNLGPRTRSLVEVRFMTMPNGARSVDRSDGSVDFTNTTVEDPVELHRELRWGGIQIERAWVEHELHELFTIRAGQFLSPYGIWNVDHGSPIVIATRRPFVVTEALIPERQTGLELHGRRWFPSFLVGYHLTVSNGRGPTDATADTNGNKGLGARLYTTTRLLGELSVGMSGYMGTETRRSDRFISDPADAGKPIADQGSQYQSTPVLDQDEKAGAFDLKWLYGGLHVQSEFIVQQLTYKDPARPTAGEVRYVAFQPDGRRWGFYGLIGYRTRLWGIMPFLMVERAHLISQTPTIGTTTFGLNIRARPNLVLKADYFFAWFPGALPGSNGQDSISGLRGQVAWVF